MAFSALFRLVRGPTPPTVLPLVSAAANAEFARESDLPPAPASAVHIVARAAESPPSVVPPIAELVSNYHGFLWRSIRRLGVPAADVDDAVQELFLIAHRRHHEITRGKERAFLFAVAVGVAANARRKYQRRAHREDDGADLAQIPTHATQSEALEAQARRKVLDEVLESLEDDFRIPFVLFELEEVSLQEISELLQIPLGTVSSRLRRARELFQAAATRVQARAAREVP